MQVEFYEQIGAVAPGLRVPLAEIALAHGAVETGPVIGQLMVQIP